MYNTEPQIRIKHDAILAIPYPIFHFVVRFM